MPDTPDVNEAADLLAELQRIRHSTRQSVLTNNWSMFLLWGAIFLGSVVAIATGIEAMSYYWVVVAPLGALASFSLGASSHQGVSATTKSWPFVVTVILMFVGTFGSFFVFDGTLAILVWWLVLVAGFSVFALLDGQYQLLAALALLAGWGIGLFALIESEDVLYFVLAGTFGGVLLGAGAGLRMVRR